MKRSYLTVQEVADILRINTLTAYEYIRRGELIAIKIGRNYRVREIDFQKFVKQHMTSNID